MTMNQQKIDNYVIIASLKSETVGKLINRIPGWHLDIKFTRLGFENVCRQASRCQQAFSKSCLVNLISNNTDLLFSIYYIVPRPIGSAVGVTIDAHFDYHDSITITETTITILSLSWHTIMILSRYHQVFSTIILKHG